jgi:hypothetical protein
VDLPRHTRASVRFEDGTMADIDLSYLLDYGGVFDRCATLPTSRSSARTPRPARWSRMSRIGHDLVGFADLPAKDR